MGQRESAKGCKCKFCNANDTNYSFNFIYIYREKRRATDTACPDYGMKKPTRKKYGQYRWVKLSDEEYNRLLDELGETELKRCIAYIDESAQSSGNRNHWKDWSLVIRRCYRDHWRLQQGGRSETRDISDWKKFKASTGFQSLAGQDQAISL